MTAADVIRMLMEMDQQFISGRPSPLGRAALLVALLCEHAGPSLRRPDLMGDWESIDLSPVRRRTTGRAGQPTMDLAAENDRLRAALHRIAHEPFGHAEATADQVLDAITALARETLEEE
jgi:hypothetical protein